MAHTNEEPSPPAAGIPGKDEPSGAKRLSLVRVLLGTSAAMVGFPATMNVLYWLLLPRSDEGWKAPFTVARVWQEYAPVVVAAAVMVALVARLGWLRATGLTSRVRLSLWGVVPVATLLVYAVQVRGGGYLAGYGTGFLLATLVGILVGAFVEELQFRGIVWAILARRWNVHRVSWITTVLFGLTPTVNLLSGDAAGEVWGDVLIATLLGAVLAKIRAASGSLWFAVAVHGLINYERELNHLAVSGIPDWGLYVVAVGLLIGAVLLVAYIVRDLHRSLSKAQRSPGLEASPIRAWSGTVRLMALILGLLFGLLAIPDAVTRFDLSAVVMLMTASSLLVFFWGGGTPSSSVYRRESFDVGGIRRAGLAVPVDRRQVGTFAAAAGLLAAATLLMFVAETSEGADVADPQWTRWFPLVAGLVIAVFAARVSAALWRPWLIGLTPSGLVLGLWVAEKRPPVLVPWNDLQQVRLRKVSTSGYITFELAPGVTLEPRLMRAMRWNRLGRRGRGRGLDIGLMYLAVDPRELQTRLSTLVADPSSRVALTTDGASVDESRRG